MSNDHLMKMRLFELASIRMALDAEHEEWLFSIVDMAAEITESVNPTDYLKKLRKRYEQLCNYIATNCPQMALWPSSRGC